MTSRADFAARNVVRERRKSDALLSSRGLCRRTNHGAPDAGDFFEERPVWDIGWPAAPAASLNNRGGRDSGMLAARSRVARRESRAWGRFSEMAAGDMTIGSRPYNSRMQRSLILPRVLILPVLLLPLAAFPARSARQTRQQSTILPLVEVPHYELPTFQPPPQHAQPRYTEHYEGGNPATSSPVTTKLLAGFEREATGQRA
jgi:hypothetical protein